MKRFFMCLIVLTLIFLLLLCGCAKGGEEKKTNGMNEAFTEGETSSENTLENEQDSVPENTTKNDLPPTSSTLPLPSGIELPEVEF